MGDDGFDSIVGCQMGEVVKGVSQYEQHTRTSLAMTRRMAPTGRWMRL